MRHRRRWSGSIVAAGLAVLWTVTTTPAIAADRDVTISSFAFSPSPLTVAVGDIVTWTNRDSELHTATASGEWSTGDIVGGASASIDLRTAGTYDYMCAVHPRMRGRLIVRAPGVPPTDAAQTVDTTALPSLSLVALLGAVLAVAAVVAGRRFRDHREER
jgi:plastocyanin